MQYNYCAFSIWYRSTQCGIHFMKTLLIASEKAHCIVLLSCKAGFQSQCLQDIWHMPRQNYDVLHAGMLLWAGCASHSAAFWTLRESIRWSAEICWLATGKKDDLSWQQHSLRYRSWISGDGVMNHIHRHLEGGCPGFWKETCRVPDVYGSVRGWFMAAVISLRVRGF